MKASLVAAGLAAMAEAMNPMNEGYTLRRMPQKDFENAVRANAKARIAEENRKRAEREASPREKKVKKKAPKFTVEYRKKSEPVYK